MSYSDFGGNIAVVEDPDQTEERSLFLNQYVNESLQLGLQLVRTLPSDLATPNHYLKVQNIDKHCDISEQGLKEWMPGFYFIVLQPETQNFSLAFLIVKLLLSGLIINFPDVYREAATDGVQFFIDKLNELRQIGLSIDYALELHLFSIFLENLTHDTLDSIITQLENLPLFVFLTTEIQKISAEASTALFDKRSKFFTIDMCFHVVKTMFLKIKPKQKHPQESRKVRTCVSVYEYNIPDLEVNEMFSMFNVGTGFDWNKNCIQELVKNNFKTYVTFNERGKYRQVSLEEKKLYNEICQDNCEFYSIPIEDYQVPTEVQLLQFWDIVNQYNRRKLLEPDMKFVMHCTSGNGRSAWMMITYIVMKMVEKQGVDKVLGPVINALKAIHQVCLGADENLFEKPFFLQLNNCPNALQQFAEEYTAPLAQKYTLELLSLILKNTPVMKRVRDMIEAVNAHAVLEVFLMLDSEGHHLFLLFIHWMFVICKTILHSQAGAAEPSRKKRK